MNKILSILLALLLFASCSHEELSTPFYAGQEVSISAAFSSSKNNDGKKRISGKDTHPTDPTQGEIDLTWDEGDKILVTVGDKSAVFTLSSGAGTNNATFTGTMPADGNAFHVTYPVNYTDDVLSHQTYTANGFGKGLMKMSTKAAGTLDEGFTLSADNSLLGLKLQGDANVSKIVLTQKDNDDNAENDKTYTLDCSAQVVNTADGALFYIVVPAGVWANGLKVEVYNGNGIVIEERIKTSAAEFVAGQALMMPEVAVHEYVDLGLSVLWATCNVGATTPEEYGDLFAWGETEPKEIYGWNTYKWCDGGANMTKYNTTDGLTTLLPEDDAAHVKWGGQWRMPSDVEMSELISDCTWELITKNGVKGYQITSKVEGYLDQSIFWPCAGYLNHDLNNIVSTSARYWTNKCNGSNACNLYEFETLMYNTRRCGCSIRPVLPKN